MGEIMGRVRRFTGVVTGAVAVGFALHGITALAAAGVAPGASRSAEQFDSRKMLVCETWALSAVVLLQGAHEKRRTIDAEAASLYDRPDPFLLSLAHTADQMERGGFGSFKHPADAEKLARFLNGVCYGTIGPAPSV